MRHKDEFKQAAIWQATIELLNEIGFADISISKIAKRAQVSPSTIYVYFDSKEDMLSKLYWHVKQQMSVQLLSGIQADMPVKPAFETFFRNYIAFILTHKDEFLFLEQFANSPVAAHLSVQDASWMFQPLYELIDRGREQHLLKDCDTMLLLMMLSAPMAGLAKQVFKNQLQWEEQHTLALIQMSWDAIKA